MCLILAALLLVGGRARAQEPAYDALAELFTRETPRDATAGGAIPERGETLTRLSADLTLAAQGLESFRSPEDAERALTLALERVPPELKSRFSSRRQALDTLYRTLAVTDYTWAARFPGENCSASDWRARLLASPDGLFKDPKTGSASPWIVRLLGPDALKGVEKALDNASSVETAKGREYELLRAKAAKAAAALDAAPEDKRAWLHCLRGEAYEKLALANQVSEGPIAASRGTIPSRGVALIGRTANGVFEAHGAGVLITTKAGARILTDAKVVGDGEGYQAAFPDKGTPIPVTIERKGETLAVLSSPQDLGEGRDLSNADPAKDDLVTVVSHSERLGAWAWTQGLVSEAQEGAFQTDAVVDAAQAGGAVLDENGRVAGLLTLRNAEAEDGEGEWPVGMPASAIKSWLDGGELRTAGLPIRLQDAGTSSIIQASYIYSQTQWGSVRGKCVANCGGGSSYSGGYSSNPGAEALGRAMGEALGQGVRALFKGLGSMFRSKGNGFKPRRSSPSRSVVVKTEKAKPVEPPKPPEPKKCSVQLVNSSRDIGFEPIEMNIRLDCRGGASPAGRELEVVVGWKDDKTPIKRCVRTDAAGQARILLEVNGVEKDFERQFDDLDRYDRELRERAEREALARESDRSGLTSASSGVALEKAKEVVTAPQTAVAIRAVPGVMLLGVEIGAAAAVTGGVAIVGASTYLTYQRMKADVERRVEKEEKNYSRGTAELRTRRDEAHKELDANNPEETAILAPQDHFEGIPGRWKCRAQCNVQTISPSANCPERVTGAGGGPSEEIACRTAKRAATQTTPRGCYPRHCKCDCIGAR